MSRHKTASSRNALRLALAQINCTVGDLEGNCALIAEYAARAAEAQADAVIFPELTVTGYPPEDLLCKDAFIRDNLAALKALAPRIKGTSALVGFVDRREGKLYNAAALIAEGRIRSVTHKMLLPNYGVFDEKRYFTPASKAQTLRVGGTLLGVNICEDIWSGEGPLRMQAMKGCRVILALNASPYHLGKFAQRQEIIRRQARKHKVTVAYVNMVGGQDELVFDGQSMVVDASGKVVALARAFEEELLLVDLANPAGSSRAQELAPEAEAYGALVLGLKDYVRKNGFEKVVVGLSGGVDSALVAALAADALGPQQVTGIFMPSRYSSQESRRDAQELARNLGIGWKEIPIDHIYKVFLLTLEAHFAGAARNIAEENLQARIRGTMLMAFSNKFNWLVLTTGNKSEMSTGYATLYGDMAGGFAVIKDVPKMLVYDLCLWRNSQSAAGPLIPENVLKKAPTAELRYGQKDSDTLPEYPVLDPILKAYVEEDKDVAQVAARGFDREVVRRVARMVDVSEYKRRQAPPGVKITPKAFGRDRRMPITNHYGKGAKKA